MCDGVKNPGLFKASDVSIVQKIYNRLAEEGGGVGVGECVMKERLGPAKTSYLLAHLVLTLLWTMNECMAEKDGDLLVSKAVTRRLAMIQKSLSRGKSDWQKCIACAKHVIFNGMSSHSIKVCQQLCDLLADVAEHQSRSEGVEAPRRLAKLIGPAIFREVEMHVAADLMTTLVKYRKDLLFESKVDDEAAKMQCVENNERSTEEEPISRDREEFLSTLRFDPIDATVAVPIDATPAVVNTASQERPIDSPNSSTRDRDVREPKVSDAKPNLGKSSSIALDDHVEVRSPSSEIARDEGSDSTPSAPPAPFLERDKTEKMDAAELVAMSMSKDIASNDRKLRRIADILNGDTPESRRRRAERAAARSERSKARAARRLEASEKRAAEREHRSQRRNEGGN